MPNHVEKAAKPARALSRVHQEHNGHGVILSFQAVWSEATELKKNGGELVIA